MKKISEVYLRPLIDLETQATAVDKLMPRNANIYAYHFDQSNRTLYEFNTHSCEKSSAFLQSVQARDAGVALLPDGRLFLAGGVGITSSKTTRACLLYNPFTEEEDTTVQPLPRGLRGLRLVATETQVYAVAGFDPNADDSQEVHCFVYKLQSQKWTQMKTLCYRVRYPAVALLEKCIYAVGGEEIASDGLEEMRDCVQVYDLTQNVWSLKTCTYPLLCKNMGSFLLQSHRLLIYGGESEDGDCVLSSFVFDGEIFEPVAELPGDAAVTHFNDPACVGSTAVYVFSSCGELYCFDKPSQTWQLEELEELTNNRV